MRAGLVCLLVATAELSASTAIGQATTRACTPVEEPGPACLLARQRVSHLPSGRLYWLIDRFSNADRARKAGLPTSTVIQAFKATWLFTLSGANWRAKGGERVTQIGPLPIPLAPSYQAEYLRSIFAPGTTAPLHRHSGPEAFFAVDGDTCLETPDGVQIGRGPGNSLLVKAGTPMLLMAIGKVPRRGFALILHDAGAPPTTLTQAWQPTGLCARQLTADQARATAPMINANKG
ncbi:cupin domain-containing protein [Sphingomonas bacterium]|uniref:cupin domain-containing protein n=1 Tax=Sphingomonas bacterium TaxID=1895847 RepID=UPI001575EE78